MRVGKRTWRHICTALLLTCLTLPGAQPAKAHPVPLEAAQTVSSSSKSIPAGVLFRSGPQNKREVALTFDDGPDLVYTPRILDILKKEHVHATFFLVGKSAQKYPWIAKRIAEEGHVIGNHSYDHALFTKLQPEQIRTEIIQADKVLSKITGVHSDLFRPPYGAASVDNVLQVAAMDYKIIDWSVDTRDWSCKSEEEILDNVNKQTTPGGIILEHSAGPKSIEYTVKSLPYLIHNLKAKGYQLVSVPQLLGIPAVKE